MVTTILPIVYGGHCQMRSGLRYLWLYSLGGAIGGAITGTALGGLTALCPFPIAVDTGLASLLSSLLCGVYAARDLELARVPVLQSRWQVPRRWVTGKHPTFTATFFGMLLGAGLFTRIPASTLYPGVVWIVLRGNPRAGAVVMAFFGLVRAAPLWWIYCTSRNAAESAAMSQLLQGWQPAARLLSAGTAIFVGASLLTMVWRGRIG